LLKRKLATLGISLGCAAALVTALASPAFANGRFPRAQRLIQSTENANVIALYGTYGMIVTEDGGKTWHHLCEAATGTYNGEDPLLEILPGTRIVARTDGALVASQDNWCNFRSVFGNGTDAVDDITRDPAAPNGIVALVGSYDKTAGFSSRVISSTDSGRTWSSPLPLPSASIAQGLSLDLAPSAPDRLYATGLDAMGQGNIVVSDDRGQHFTAHTITAPNSGSAPYIAAISQKNKDVVFVRTDGFTDLDGIDTASDGLLVSTDAGVTWTTVLSRHAKLFGFALSPNETTLLAGFGDPQLSATTIDPMDAGLYEADVATLLADLAHGEAHFTKIFASSITCLRWTPQNLFACTLAGETGFEVGRAADASFTLATGNPFTPLLLLKDVTPLPCGEGTSAYGCFTDPVNGFPGACSALGASCSVTAPPPGTVSGVYTGSGAASAVGGTTANLGGEPQSGGAVASGMGGAGPAPTGGAPALGAGGSFAMGGAAGSLNVSSPSGSATASSSCGCRTGPRAPSGGVVLAAVSLLASVVRRRRTQR
jgi:MYXO-CTERM domain-containing protein